MKPSRTLPLIAFEKILKENGALRISEDALELFKHITEEHIQTITREAMKYAKHAKRRTVLESDIRLAIQHLDK